MCKKPTESGLLRIDDVTLSFFTIIYLFIYIQHVVGCLVYSCWWEGGGKGGRVSASLC